MAAVPLKNTLISGRIGANASWTGRGGQIWIVSSMDLRVVVRRLGDATMAPSLCPGRQYDLENEKRWIKVERQVVDVKR